MEVLYPFYAFFIVFATLFGIVIGSFLNVVIYRIPEGRTISKGHSMCMSCGHELAAKDLVPLFSWLFLRGKCRYCKAPVPSRYAKIESLTGFVFLITAVFYKESGLWVLDYTSKFMLYFVYYCLFVVSCAALISAMMIYHDTTKAFLGIALFTVVPGLIATGVHALMTPGWTVIFILKFVLIAAGLIVGFLVICKLLSILFKQSYTRTDLSLDLAFAGIMIYARYLWHDNYFRGIISYAAFAVFYSIFRRIMKKSSNDKYAAIISAGVVVIFLIIRYFILVFN